MGTVARMALREISRRRGVLALMIVLPLSFYLVKRDLAGQSIRFLALGIGWATSTLSLFGACSARPVEQRLRLTGMGTWRLVGGRLIAVQLCGVGLAGFYLAVVVADQHVARPWAIGVLLVTTALVAATVGAALGAMVSRELEGALALLTLVATQMLADPEQLIARLLPFWSTRELATYAVDDAGTSYLVAGLVHAAGTFALALGLAAVVMAVRLRVVRWPAPPLG